jgi:2-hydroxychromene-2-carboxylate isomerase
MAAAQIDFWFTMGSTYSFLSVMRLEELERSTGITFRWRPFDLLVILQKMKHVPFADKPTKFTYMWRDVERRAAMYGIPAQLPAPYPAKQSVVANLVATVGIREGWGADFARAALALEIALIGRAAADRNKPPRVDPADQECPWRTLDV